MVLLFVSYLTSKADYSMFYRIVLGDQLALHLYGFRSKRCQSAPSVFVSELCVAVGWTVGPGYLCRLRKTDMTEAVDGWEFNK